MWIDTHCHLDAPEFDADRAAVVAQARAVGVTMAVLPAVHVDWFDKAASVATEHGLAYALGLHPLWLESAQDEHLERLRAAAQAAMADARFVAIGEIGLDFFIAQPDVEWQERFYLEQLKIARALDLPVIVHVRRSADALLKYLRRVEVPGGIVHAFNGSEQQAHQFIALGFKLGFGGAMTYNGSQRIRRLAATLPLQSIVLETDAPDIPPAWLRAEVAVGRNAPGELPRIAHTLLELRRAADPGVSLSMEDLAAHTRENAQAALPRLRALLADDAQAA
jgi:TatD DNase family protein